MIIGGNTKLAQRNLIINHTIPSSTDLSVFFLTDNNKVEGDDGMIFYGAPISPCGSIKLSTSTIECQLDKVPLHIVKLAITATVDTGSFATHSDIVLSCHEFKCSLSTASRSEAALILMELYRYKDEWKARFVAQGFNGGLQPLAEHFGVDIDDTPAPIVPETNTSLQVEVDTKTSPVSLSKISLTKHEPKVDLTKRVGTIGLIKANLNWTQSSGGFFSSNIDLDLGAYVELHNGQKVIVQALGKNFHFPPYVQLLADDRTGASKSGEWLHINGDSLFDVKRIMIFSFIYSGAANWAKADASVTIHVPDMPNIETQLTAEESKKGFCAIAELQIINGVVKIERINKFFKGHKQCDEAFGWGLQWSSGSK
jgi:tellurite resistance protein TerA